MQSDTFLKTYRDRWKSVSEFEMKKLAEMSIELKWKQLNANYRLARRLGILPENEMDQSIVERWNLLRND